MYDNIYVLPSYDEREFVCKYLGIPENLRPTFNNDQLYKILIDETRLIMVRAANGIYE